MKYLAIDTNIIVNAITNSNKQHIYLRATDCICQCFGLAIDYKRSILKEYNKNCENNNYYRKFISCFHQRGAFYYCSGVLNNIHVKQLSSLGCHEPQDHVFLAVACNSDRILVSEDSDFGKGAKGTQPPHQDALNYIQNCMQISVLDANEFLMLFKNICNTALSSC